MESQAMERTKPKRPEPLVGKYFRAVIAEAHELRLWLEALKVVHDEPTIIVDYRGIKVRQMDPSRTTAVHFELDRYVFDEFDVSLRDEEDIKLAVAVAPILKLLRGVKRRTRRRPATKAEFGLNEEQKLWLRLYNGYSQEITFTPLEPDEPFGELKVPFTAKITLDAQELLRAVKDLVKAFEAEYARITIDSDGLHITAENWEGHEFKATFGRIDESVLDHKVDEPATAVFDATELLKILKVGAKLADVVEVELATNKPIRLGFKLPYSAVLTYYLSIFFFISPPIKYVLHIHLIGGLAEYRDHARGFIKALEAIAKYRLTSMYFLMTSGEDYVLFSEELKGELQRVLSAK